MSDETRVCRWCGKTKPLGQFPTWLLDKPGEQRCLRCRGWEDSSAPLEDLVEELQRSRREWEQNGFTVEQQQRQQQRQQEWELEQEQARRPVTSPQEKQYVQEMCQYYQDQEAHERRLKRQWRTLRTRHIDAYTAWAHKLLDSGSTPEDVRKIADVEFLIFRGRLEWPRKMRADIGRPDPPFSSHVQRRKSILKRQRHEIYEQQQGKCYYCGCDVASPDQPFRGSPEFEAVRKAYLEELRAIRAGGPSLNFYLRPRLRHSNLGLRYQRLRSQEKAAALPQEHIDHRLPVTRGGTDERSNLVLACETCNEKKGMRTEEEFKAMPDDPISRLNNYDVFLDGITPALYEAEQRGYTILPLVDGYPLSGLGVLKTVRYAWAATEWQRSAYENWLSIQERRHGNGVPYPKWATDSPEDRARIKYLHKLAILQVEETKAARKRSKGTQPPAIPSAGDRGE